MKKAAVMPTKFNSLAVYNSEISRGLVHTSDWQTKMEKLQEEFDAWIRDSYTGDDVLAWLQRS